MRFPRRDTLPLGQRVRPCLRTIMLVAILQAALAPIANHCLAGGTWSEYSWGGWAGSYLVGLCALVGFARRRWLVPPVVFGCGILFMAITLCNRPFLHPCIRRALPWAAAFQVAVFSLAFTTAAWARSRSAFALAMVGTFLCSSLVVPLILKETITPKAKYELPMRATIVEVDARGDRALLETGCLVGDLRVWHRDGWLDSPDERFAYDCLLGCRFRESEVRLVCRRFDTEICESCHLAVVDWDGTSWIERLNMELPLSQVAVAGQGNVLSPDGDLIVLNGGRWSICKVMSCVRGRCPLLSARTRAFSNGAARQNRRHSILRTPTRSSSGRRDKGTQPPTR